MSEPPRPKYRPPLDMFLSVSRSIFFGWPRRSLARDATDMLNRHTPRPTLSGVEHIPRQGAFMIVANHYHRRDMWIGWAGALISEAVNRIRPAEPPIRIVVTDAQRMTMFGREQTIPLSGWLLGRVARFWGMIPLSADPSNAMSHVASLRNVLRVLKRGEPVLFFPEGEAGSAYHLVEALPGTGTFMALANDHAALIPCAFWEDGATLRGQLAPPLTLHAHTDQAVRDQVMIAIGQMLPDTMWNGYSDAIRASRDLAQ